MSIQAIRWILLVEGWLLLLGPGALVKALAEMALGAQNGSPEALPGIDPEQFREATKVLAKLMVVFMGVGALSLASAWGLKRNRIWAKWAGLVSGVVQLLGFPIFTIAGGVVIWGLWKWEPVEAEASGEPRHPDEGDNPVAQGIRMAITFALLILACSQLYRFTASIGLPPSDWGELGIVYLFLGQFVVTILHELGHLFAAFAVGFRFEVINVGPVTVFKDARGRRTFDFNFRRIFSHSGFLGAIPKTEENLRSNMMILVFAGPFVSLNVGALLFLTMLSTPGTELAAYGEIMGYAAVIFGLDFVANLIPVGHCDGSMLLGLALNNATGKRILAALTAAMHSDRADAAAGEGSIEDRIDARKKAIEVAREFQGGAEKKTAHSGQGYIQLGLAELQSGAAAQAEEHFKKALDIFDGMKTGAHPVLRAAALDGLARALQALSRYNESRAAGEQAIELYEASKEKLPSMDGLLEVNLNIADLQLALGQHGDAIMTIEQAVTSLPGGAKNALMTARLYRVHAAAALGGKSTQAGSSVRRAVQMLQSPSMRPQDRIAAYTELAALANDLWAAGSDEAAIELARTAVAKLVSVSASNDVVSRCKLAVAEMLGRKGRFDEAEATLSTIPEAVAGQARKLLLETRAYLHLHSNKMEESLASYRELLRLEGTDRETASVKVSLALVYEAMEQGEEAANWARDACNTLMPLEHPDAAEALFALSRVMYASGDENAEAYFEEGRRIVVSNEMLPAARKVRMFESAAPKFEASNWKGPAKMLTRDVAQLRASIKTVELTAPVAAPVEGTA